MAETTTNTKVNVVTGALSKIQSAEQGNGKIYFSTEGQLYYDFNGQRIKVQGGNSTIFKGTCVTPAATVAKVVTCGIFKSTDLVQGALIAVTFTYTNTYATLGSLTLNVDNTGAKPIKKQSNTSVSNLTAAGELIAGQTYFFQYDGTNWVCMNLDYNTTYDVMSVSEASTGTATSGRVITAKVLADEITRRINSSISGLDSSVAVETGKAIAGFEEVNGKITNVTRVDTGLTGDTIGSYIPNNFSTISVKAKSASDTAIDVIPNSSNGTLTFIGSTNVKLTANATADTITIDASNTTYSAGTGISITGTNNAINATTPNFSALDISSGGITTKVLGDATALQQSHTSKLTLEAGSNVALTAANTADGAKVTISAQMQNGVIGIGISTIRAISESEYAALAGSRDPSTVYIVTPDTEV